MAGPVFDTKTHIVPCQNVREDAQALSDENATPVLEVKQYIPLQNARLESTVQEDSSQVTVLMVGGLGLIKETLEPLMEDVMKILESKNEQVRAFWSADMAYVGGSARLNEEVNGNAPHWWDFSRDLLHLTNHFRSHFRPPIVGVGHSLGAACLVSLSIMHPSLFSSLILLEPALYTHVGRIPAFAQGKSVALREDSWPSRDAMEKSIRQSPYYRAWDARALQKHIDHGFYTVSGSSEVRTTTTRDAEVMLLARRYNPTGVAAPSKGGFESMTLAERLHFPDVDPESVLVEPYYNPYIMRAWRYLPELRPRVLYVEAELGQTAADSPFPRLRLEMTGTGLGGSGGMRLGQVERVVIPEARHNLVVEKKAIANVSQVIAGRIKSEMAVWRQRRQEVRAQTEWHLQSRERKQMAHPDILRMFQAWDGKAHIPAYELAQIERIRKRRENGAEQRQTRSKL